jgi:hypothetical protein
MILWGVSMMRNEEDIVEAFVRHNLGVLDGLLVVDHSSTDGTSAILAALSAERLPLVVKRHDAPGYLQSEVTTTAAREVFARTTADFVFPLDADEFLKIGDRASLEAFLATLPPNTHARFDWPTYAPAPGAPLTDVVSIARSARRIVDLPVGGKVAVARGLASIPGAYIGQGNHDIFVGTDPRVAPRLPMVRAPASMCIAHLPVRNAARHTIKFGVRRLARIAAKRGYPPASNAYRAFAAIKTGEPPTMNDLLRPYVDGFIASDDGREPTDRPTVDDPFLGEITLRYTRPLVEDPLPVVLAAVDGLARRLAAYRRDGWRRPR